MMKPKSLILLFIWISASCAYKRVHREAVLIDTHNDLLSSVTLKGLRIEDDLTGIAHSDLKRFADGGVDVQIFSIFCDEKYGNGTAFAYANREIDSLYAIASRSPMRLKLVSAPDELKQAIGRYSLVGMMGVEGGHMIEDDLGNLDSFYKRGVRYMTLTWNNSTSWASSAKDERANSMGDRAAGLNAFGRRVVKRMNEMGMIVDVSHTGERTFYDALSVTTKPVIASHSSVYALCPVFRNLKDDQIRAIGRNGGVIHINFYSGFLDSNYDSRIERFIIRHQTERDSMVAKNLAGYEIRSALAKKYPKEADSIRASLSQVLDHIDYVVKLIGVDHVGIGSDFDGIDSSPINLDGVQDFPRITRGLLKRGYDRNEVKKILGGNFIRVFEQNAAGGK